MADGLMADGCWNRCSVSSSLNLDEPPRRLSMPVSQAVLYRPKRVCAIDFPLLLEVGSRGARQARSAFRFFYRNSMVWHGPKGLLLPESFCFLARLNRVFRLIRV